MKNTFANLLFVLGIRSELRLDSDFDSPRQLPTWSKLKTNLLAAAKVVDHCFLTILNIVTPLNFEGHVTRVKMESATSATIWIDSEPGTAFQLHLSSEASELFLDRIATHFGNPRTVYHDHYAPQQGEFIAFRVSVLAMLFNAFALEIPVDFENGPFQIYGATVRLSRNGRTAVC